MRWAANRDTKKKEDRAYCLLGIFDVSMSLRYGEGEKAFVRLENKVTGSSKCKTDLSLAHNHLEAEDAADSEVITWLAPVRPEELQAKVSASRHPGSGFSFTTGPLMSWLRDEADRNSLMWIMGKCRCLGAEYPRSDANDYLSLFSRVKEKQICCRFSTPLS